jgi:hypothetical protein
MNTTRSVAEATVGILVQPIVLGMNTSGTVLLVFRLREDFALEDAIGSHASSLD